MSFRTKALGAVCAACIAASGFVYSQRSITNLNETRVEMQTLGNCAIERTPVDYVIVDGGRTQEEHLKNVANGKSWTKRSRHQDGAAIDIAAYVEGKITYEAKYYEPILGTFYFCSELHNIPIITGGEWKAGDFMHIELDRKYYP
jgi:peptidoglycan L-alanyl-D-glutamate endopeptidase CwlK